MKSLRGPIVSLCLAFLAATGANAASTTDYSDQWWTVTEPGWGASIQQQANMLFVNLMVYGSDGNAAWFTSAASLQATKPPGHDVFVGDLYATTGPAGGGSFDPTTVVARKVGTLVFDASGFSTAMLSYSVDGIPIVKNVTRQTWNQHDLEGTYEGDWFNNCGYAAPFDWTPATIVVWHDPDNTISISVSCSKCATPFTHALRGTYVQYGHLGQITAELVAPDFGTMTISEIEKTAVAFLGRLRGSITVSGQTCQVTNGQMGAVRVP